MYDVYRVDQCVSDTFSRQSGQDDLVVGTPFACQRYARISGSTRADRWIFRECKLVRGDLTGMPTFQEVVRRARNSSTVR